MSTSKLIVHLADDVDGYAEHLLDISAVGARVIVPRPDFDPTELPTVMASGALINVVLPRSMTGFSMTWLEVAHVVTSVEKFRG